MRAKQNFSPSYCSWKGKENTAFIVSSFRLDISDITEGVACVYFHDWAFLCMRLAMHANDFVVICETFSVLLLFSVPDDGESAPSRENQRRMQVF